MFARVTSARIEKDKIEQFKKIFKKSVVPAAKKQEGFKAIYLLVDRKSGEGLSITYWTPKRMPWQARKTSTTSSRWPSSCPSTPEILSGKVTKCWSKNSFYAAGYSKILLLTNILKTLINIPLNRLNRQAAHSKIHKIFE